MEKRIKMIDQKKRYVIDNYGKKSVFSNFLPSISGERGVPLWCFYVNRGQAIASFGIQDKDHSIMQFFPAQQAYTHTKRMGFRTFIKMDGKVSELFSKEEFAHQMAIGMNELEISENNKELGLQTNVKYYTLPSENFAGLIRKVTIKNTSTQKKSLEYVDGMAAILPYGVDLALMNEMGQTVKAWMQVLNHESKTPIFKVRASIKDSAQVTEVKGGNYGLGMTEAGEEMPVIVSSETLFGYDTSLDQPVEFKEKDVDVLGKENQKTENIVPCCFFTGKTELNPGESYSFYEMYGQVEDVNEIESFRKKIKDCSFFEDKYKEDLELTEKLTDKIHTKTNNEIFDMYCRQTYLDNVLRGGEPIQIGMQNVFYLYSRKHGDMERDYNYFTILPENYSQGNGNFRDVNQNRRCDIRFSPYVGDRNIRMFYNAIQLDGYNPLGIEKTTYKIRKEIRDEYQLDGAFYLDEFTPGALMKELRKENKESLFETIIGDAESISKTDFKEGYWTDHWTYNLDLVEEFLAIYPDKEEELLFRNRSYTYRIPKETILPRDQRYEETEQGIRQYHYLIENPAFVEGGLIKDQDGKIVYHTLLEKIILLCIVKFAALDPYGMGIEMEGGKPGWYDALNGLPGLLGSSMAETYELSRMLEFVVDVLKKYDHEILLPKELDELRKSLIDESVMYVANRENDKHAARMTFWKDRGGKLEVYREEIKETLTGENVAYQTRDLLEDVKLFLQVVKQGVDDAILEAKESGNGVVPTYFYYTVLDYHVEEMPEENRYEIQDVKQERIPAFLEGSVRFLKQKSKKEEKEKIYEVVKNSALYDQELKMYKVNAGLADATYEIGRAKAFTPGWLENESVWMHMEYKYLLELLKSEMYDEFMEDFQNAAIPFLKEEVYGRSLLENSSFIASSANPDQKIHGKGFVARLSGSTVEFMHMWQIMMFGKNPFVFTNEELQMKFEPCIPDYLIGENQKIETMFLGRIPVTYHLPDRKHINKDNSFVAKYILLYANETKEVEGETIFSAVAEDVRNGVISEMDVYIERRGNE